MSFKIFSVLVFVCINTVVSEQPIYVEPGSLDFSTSKISGNKNRNTQKRNQQQRNRQLL